MKFKNDILVILIQFEFLKVKRQSFMSFYDYFLEGIVVQIDKVSLYNTTLLILQTLRVSIS